MKKSVFLMAFGLMIACAPTQTAQKPPANSLNELVNNDKTLFLDVRVPEQFQEKTVAGAVNIPLADLEQNLGSLQKSRPVVVFCNSGRQAGEALTILKNAGFKNVVSGINVATIENIKNQKVMNIINDIQFSNEKANVLPLKKTEKIKYFAVALGKNAVLKKHTAPVPSTLVVLKGEINFVLNDRSVTLKEFDVFEIPVNEEHEVIGLGEQNLFTVTQEL